MGTKIYFLILKQMMKNHLKNNATKKKVRGCPFSSSDATTLTMNDFHSASKIREVNDLSLRSLECYLSFLCFLTHEVNKRCLRGILSAEVSNTIVIQLNGDPRRNECSKYTQNPRLTSHMRPNRCYLMGLCFTQKWPHYYLA